MKGVNVNTIGDFIREQREQAKISLRELARMAGVSNPYLSQIERGLRRPSADILQQIAKGLRISAEALYVQAGFLEDRSPGSGTRDAILTDPELTERQKQMLLDIYDSFRKERVLAGEPGSPVPQPAPPPVPGEAAELEQSELERAALDEAVALQEAARDQAEMSALDEALARDEASGPG
jgi:transcriptional regulator with XRE-family HTH domain